MRAIIQRVLRASVTVEDKVVGSIGKGLCVLIGICEGDAPDDADYITRKILGTRLFEAEGKEWRQSVTQADLEILCVSQFTLYAKLKGNKPDFHLAMKGDRSQEVYKSILAALAKGHRPDAIQDGVFGAMMAVELVNDGPVTIVLDSKSRDPITAPADSTPTSTKGAAGGGDAQSSGKKPGRKARKKQQAAQAAQAAADPTPSAPDATPSPAASATSSAPADAAAAPAQDP